MTSSNFNINSLWFILIVIRDKMKWKKKNTKNTGRRHNIKKRSHLIHYILGIWTFWDVGESHTIDCRGLVGHRTIWIVRQKNNTSIVYTGKTSLWQVDCNSIFLLLNRIKRKICSIWYTRTWLENAIQQVHSFSVDRVKRNSWSW